MSDRSEKFRVAATKAKTLGPAELVLLEEVCRLIDRLDRYNDTLRYDLDDPKIAREARLLAAEVRQAVKQLALPEAAEAAKGPSRYDELAAKRAKTG